MIIPDEFCYFVGCFIQHSDEWVKSEDDWIAFARRLSDVEKQLVIKKFIGELLAGDATDQELTHIWNSSGASYGQSEDYAREFLTKIRNAIPVGRDRKIELNYR